MPVFMAATPEFVEKNPDAVVTYLKAWLQVGKDFKENPGKVADVIFDFYKSKGYTMSKDTFKKAIGNVDVNPGFPDMVPYMTNHAEALIKAKKIKKVPDWKTALRPEFMKKAMG